MKTKKFMRCFSDEAMEAAKSYTSELAKLTQAGPWAIELRPGNDLTIYYRGQAALKIMKLGGTKAGAKRFSQKVAEKVPEPKTLKTVLAEEKQAVDDHLAGKHHGRHTEISVQAELMGWLAQNGDFLPLDQQVAVPASDLIDQDLRRVRVDLLTVEKKTNTLWLMELKLSTNEELDGAVLHQLELTCKLPAALTGGVEQFIDHYQKLLDQKYELGLIAEHMKLNRTPHKTALVVIGDERETLAKLECWPDGPGHQADLPAIILPNPSSLPRDAFKPLGDLYAEAERKGKAGLLPPWAPKKPIHNTFTEAETKKQKKWLSEGKPKRNTLGPFAAEIEDYITKHDAPRHTHLDHPISSQAACFQFFAPLLTKQAGADQAWHQLLSPHLAKLGIKPTAIEECHFEYPHQGQCRTKGKPCNHDMAALVGEKGSMTTRLDAFLKVKGTKNGTEIRVAVGIEFKYTESEFSRCGGFTSRNNHHGHACLGRQNPDRRPTCYLRNQEGRKYLTDEALAKFFKPDTNPLTTPGPCLLLGPANQIYRSQYTT
ncbi:MAG: hypothetical protein JRF33_25990, partial [Deltaproteobacteria bacterium]|nr:hypothetical protein [Deltaproteobacteria bacterium]